MKKLGLIKFRFNRYSDSTKYFFHNVIYECRTFTTQFESTWSFFAATKDHISFPFLPNVLPEIVNTSIERSFDSLAFATQNISLHENQFWSSDEVIYDRCPRKASRMEKRRREGGSQSSLKFQNVPSGITLAACSFNASAGRFTVTGWAPRLSDIEIFTLRVWRSNGTETSVTLISILELATALFLASVHEY